jgi:hypothetical protein
VLELAIFYVQSFYSHSLGYLSVIDYSSLAEDGVMPRIKELMINSENEGIRRNAMKLFFRLGDEDAPIWFRKDVLWFDGLAEFTTT